MEAVKKKLQEELDGLEEELHFKLPKEIQKAREFGDLRENAEYKAAMERQSIVQARIAQIQSRIASISSSGPAAPAGARPGFSAALDQALAGPGFAQADPATGPPRCPAALAVTSAHAR